MKLFEHETQNIFCQLRFLVQSFLFNSCLKVKKWENFYQDEIESTNPGRKFSEFLQIFMKLSGFKAQVAPNAEKYQLSLR